MVKRRPAACQVCAAQGKYGPVNVILKGWTEDGVSKAVCWMHFHEFRKTSVKLREFYAKNK